MTESEAGDNCFVIRAWEFFRISAFGFCHFMELPLPPDFAIPAAMESKEALVALNMIEHVGPVRVRQLLEHFADAPSVLRASKSQLLQARGIGEETAGAIANWEKSVDLSCELRRVKEFG